MRVIDDGAASTLAAHRGAAVRGRKRDRDRRGGGPRDGHDRRRRRQRRERCLVVFGDVHHAGALADIGRTARPDVVGLAAILHVVRSLNDPRERTGKRDVREDLVCRSRTRARRSPLPSSRSAAPSPRTRGRRGPGPGLSLCRRCAGSRGTMVRSLSRNANSGRDRCRGRRSVRRAPA